MKTLKPNRNNIETYLPIFGGFYGSIYGDSDFYGEAEYYGLPAKFDFWPFFKQDEYYNALSKYFCDCVESAMSEFIERVDFQSLYSPREYNFKNDSINCIIRPKKKAIAAYIYANKEAFCEYLKEHLKSRDGFISSHSHYFEDWEINTKKFTAWDKEFDSRGFNLGFVLSFIAGNEDLTEENTFDEYNAHVYQNEFLNDEFYEMVDTIEGNEFVNKENLINARQNNDQVLNLPEQIELIKKFVRENYLNLNVRELTLATFSDIETGLCQTLADFLYIDKIIASQMQEIENKTLELVF